MNRTDVTAQLYSLVGVCDASAEYMRSGCGKSTVPVGRTQGRQRNQHLCQGTFVPRSYGSLYSYIHLRKLAFHGLGVLATRTE